MGTRLNNLLVEKFPGSKMEQLFEQLFTIWKNNRSGGDWIWVGSELTNRRLIWTGQLTFARNLHLQQNAAKLGQKAESFCNFW